MTDLRKAAEQALEALDCLPWQASPIAVEATQALRQALAQPEQEPVYAFRRKGLDYFCTCDKRRYDELAGKPNLFEVTVFYTAPPKREWVGLTGEDIDRLTKMHLRAYPTYPGFYGQTDFARAIDALLKEKNT
jgi:hypothetical protein